MTPTLTAEQIAELEALLAKDGEPVSHVFNCMNFAAALRNAAPALIAMADRTSRAEMAGKWSSDVASMAIQDKERAEAELVTLLGRLKSTESALDRAMARSNSWREEAAKLQAQMLADKGIHIAGEEAETPRTCETCAHLLKNLGEDQCLGCGGQQSALSRWTPKPIPSTSDKGEKP